MTMDASLKSASGLVKHRNVLTRAERIEQLTNRGRFDAKTHDPVHLPKVANRKVAAKKTVKKGEAEEEEAATPEA